MTLTMTTNFASLFEKLNLRSDDSTLALNEENNPFLIETTDDAENQDPNNSDDFLRYVALVERKVQTVKDALERSSFHQKPGFNQLLRKMKKECELLTSLAQKGTKQQAEGVQNSSLASSTAVARAALNYDTRVYACYQSHSYINKQERASDKIDVSLVLDEGSTWVKVCARSTRQLATMCKEEGIHHRVVEQARTWLKVSECSFYRIKTIVFKFVYECPDYLQILLTNMGIKVEAPRIVPLGECVVLPPDFEMPELKEPEIATISPSVPLLRLPNEIPRRFAKPAVAYDCVNLDLEAVIALISNITNGGAHCTYASCNLNTEACAERVQPMKTFIEECIQGKRVIVSKMVVDTLLETKAPYTGPKEKERLFALLKRVEIVDNEPTERVKALDFENTSDADLKTVFGTGDHYNAFTMTSNKRFIVAAARQGVKLQVIVCGSRSLSELKVAPPEDAN